MLVALSGGADSVALLGALVALGDEYGVTLEAAHLNHRLRGEESQRDQAYAEAVALSLAVPCHVESCETLPPGPNLEARARAQRYAFLTRVATARGCTKIATGHTLDDQAETVLMRLLRGAGWDGLKGIHPIRDGRVLRPMIECSRQQVLAFLQTSGLRFCEDSSNQERRFLRNRVRHEVIPLLEGINPAVKHNLASAAKLLTEEGAWLDDRVQAILGPADSGDGSLAVATLLNAPPALQARVLRAWLRARRGDLRRLTAKHVSAIIDVAFGARPNGQVRLPGGQLVVREYDRLRLCQMETTAAPEPARVLTPGLMLCLSTGWQISAEIVGAEEARGALPTSPFELLADAERLAGPLLVRTPRPGDRVRPLGLQGRRKLQDVFVDHKLALTARRSYPVVESNGQILWVPGVVRSDGALITPSTRAAVRVLARNAGIAAP